MRVYLSAPYIRKSLRWFQVGLFVIGALFILYCVIVLFEAYRFQQDQSLMLKINRATPASLRTVGYPTKQVGLDQKAWSIEIERLGVSVMVGEGTSPKQLRLRAGHITGTSLPGQGGNTAVSAHRDTYFRALRNIKQNDLIVVTTRAAQFRYKVASVRLVWPSDLSVLSSQSGQTLTMITCYPFYFIGAAPKRFVVLAERVI